MIIVIFVTEERLRGAIVRVGNNKDHMKNKICGRFNEKSKSFATIQCNLKGRYLSVNLPGKNYLTLCEVKAFSGNCRGKSMA